MAHRAIQPSSRIYWYKDHHISFHIDRDSRSLLLAARTPNAVVHRAVLEMAASVNAELATCATLAHGGAFLIGSIPENQRNRYEWKWPAQLSQDVAEKDSSFVYIDGAFRPDVERTLSLLSGIPLYGNPYAAIRELLQNAVDAVRAQIAYERLLEDAPADLSTAERLGDTHRIRLSLEIDSGHYWLKCSDDGTGMSKSIIERQLLVSASKPTPENIGLERVAKSAGFSVGRTGQFGIGVLSYFMISDRVEITTRRSVEAGDPDAKGWWFGTEGIAQFGELVPFSRGARGTDVRLRLKKDVLGKDWNEVVRNVTSYVSESFINSPCRFEVKDESCGSIVYATKPGWTATLGSLTDRALGSFRFYEDDTSFVSNARLENRERRSAAFRKMIETSRAQIRLFGPQEISLPEDMGTARIFLPYFEGSKGNCLGLIGGRDFGDVDLYDGLEVVIPEGNVR